MHYNSRHFFNNNTNYLIIFSNCFEKNFMRILKPVIVDFCRLSNIYLQAEVSNEFLQEKMKKYVILPIKFVFTR